MHVLKARGQTQVTKGSLLPLRPLPLQKDPHGYHSNRWINRYTCPYNIMKCAHERKKAHIYIPRSTNLYFSLLMIRFGDLSTSPSLH